MSDFRIAECELYDYNFIALHLYKNYGFKETGNADEDEIELALFL